MATKDVLEIERLENKNKELNNDLEAEKAKNFQEQKEKEQVKLG